MTPSPTANLGLNDLCIIWAKNIANHTFPSIKIITHSFYGVHCARQSVMKMIEYFL